jgi:hypothetical protein
MAFIYDLTDTWSASGTTFSAIRMNVTDTASAAASRLITLQVGGAERFGVDKAGVGLFSGAIRGPLGTGGAPAFSFTGDTNTGMWSPAADTLSFSTNGAERARITSSGNVGIGTTNPAELLDVNGNIRLTGSGRRLIADMSTNTFPNRFAFQTSTANSPTTPLILPSGSSTTAGIAMWNSSTPADASFVQVRILGTSAQLRTDADGTGTQLPLAFLVGGSERMRITDTGNVGIGLTNPSELLVAETSNGLISVGPTGWRTANRAAILIRTKSNNPSEIDLQNTAVAGENYGWQFSSRAGTTPELMIFSNLNGSFTQRLQITHDGRVRVGTGAPSAAAQLDVASTTSGFLPPRMTSTQRDAISTPPDGLMLYNTTTNKLQVRAGGSWVDLH